LSRPSVLVLFVQVVLGSTEPTGAAAAEHGIALKELSIAPISNMSGLINLGCREALKVTGKVRAKRSAQKNGRLFRHYEYRGMRVVTETGDATQVFGATIPVSALAAWGLAPDDQSRRPMSLADVERKFGKPSRRDEDKAWFGSDDDERAILLVRLDGARLTEFHWSCG
jgi:hypothetical protein